MNKLWQEFLREAGAVFKEGSVMDFGDSKGELQHAADRDVIAALPDLGFVAVTGTEAQLLLQGQSTGDVRNVTDSHSQLGGMCSPKGRMLVNFRLVRRQDGYLLLLPMDMLEATVKRLKMFVLRSDVQLNDASNELAAIGFLGDRSMQEATEVLGDLPPRTDAFHQINTLSVIRLLGDKRPRFLAFGPAEKIQPLWERLARVAAPVGRDAWELTNIRAGEPRILPETADTFVPQMVNYHAIGGVSFTKGCYTGQEVVARMQYLANLKRRMYLAHVVTDTRPLPGDELFAPTNISGQGAGRIVNAAPCPEGGYDMLAVIQIESAEKDTIHIGAANGPQLVMKSLPYSLD